MARCRRYILKPYTDGPELLLNCVSAPQNPGRADGEEDIAWSDQLHTLHPESGERVEIIVEDTRMNGELYFVEGRTLYADNTRETWTRTSTTAVSPAILDPKTLNHTVEVTVEVTMTLSDHDPEPRAAKCPVKVVFGPRLGDD
jgi:hypothetical protein